MEKIVDPNQCLNIAEFDATKICLSKPVKIVQRDTEIERFILFYESGYLQFEFGQVMFSDGISKPDELEDSSISETSSITLNISEISSGEKDIIQKIEKFVRDNFNCFDRLITKSGSYSKIVAEYVDCPEGKTQLIDANDEPIEPEFLFGRKFIGFPVLRFLVDHVSDHSYVIKIILVSIKIIDIAIPITPEIHQRTVSDETRTILKEKLSKLRSMSLPKQKLPTVHEKEERIQERPKAMKYKRYNI